MSVGVQRLLLAPLLLFAGHARRAAIAATA